MKSDSIKETTVKRQLQGIAIILFSILLTVTFNSVGWKYVFDLSLYWAHIFMITGIVGLVMVFVPEHKDE